MEIVAELVRNIAALVLLFAFSELLLPPGSLAAFIRLVLSLLLVLALLDPLVNWLGQGWPERPDWLAEATLTQQDYAGQGQRIADGLAEQAEREYATSLSRQMAAMARLRPGVAEAQAWVEIDATSGAVSSADIVIRAEAGQDATLLAAEVGEFLSAFYGLEEQLLRCTVDAEEGAEDGG